MRCSGLIRASRLLLPADPPRRSRAALRSRGGLEVGRRFCASRGFLTELTESGYHSPMKYEHLITVEPDKRSGKPCIRGMRNTVYDVLEYLASGMTEDQILNDFSELADDFCLRHFCHDSC